MSPARDAIFRCYCGATMTQGRESGYCPKCRASFQWVGAEWRSWGAGWIVLDPTRQVTFDRLGHEVT